MDFLRPYQQQLLSLLRFVIGLLLLHHGTTKYLNFPVGAMNNMNPTNIYGIAGMFELVCGALLVLGLFTRLAAFVASGLAAIAYFYAHNPRGFYPVYNGGEAAILYAFALLYIAAAGGGSISLDRLIRREAVSTA
jgi:putative oxidoreductase